MLDELERKYRPTDRFGHPNLITFAARLIGVDRASIYQAIRRGLDEHRADEWAMRCGFHPAEIWTDWLTPSAYAFPMTISPPIGWDPANTIATTCAASWSLVAESEAAAAAVVDQAMRGRDDRPLSDDPLSDGRTVGDVLRHYTAWYLANRALGVTKDEAAALTGEPGLFTYCIDALITLGLVDDDAPIPTLDDRSSHQ
ncbi:MAG TPA: hypothetical protein VHD87_08165 [Acidimicrobiales bacterium]|nr:hypothetical protein [Acidimicrobiales bacterium]